MAEAAGNAGARRAGLAAGPDSTGQLRKCCECANFAWPIENAYPVYHRNGLYPSGRISSSRRSVVMSCVVTVRSSETVRRVLNKAFSQSILFGRALLQALTVAPFLVREQADPPKRTSRISIIFVSRPGMERSSSEVQFIRGNC